jgi:hypothetical protein
MGKEPCAGRSCFAGLVDEGVRHASNRPDIVDKIGCFWHVTVLLADLMPRLSWLSRKEVHYQQHRRLRLSSACASVPSPVWS